MSDLILVGPPVVVGFKLEARLDEVSMDVAISRLYREIEPQIDLLCGFVGLGHVRFSQEFARGLRQDER